jgi:hypothetical protein
LVKISRLKDRVHLDDLRVFVPRKNKETVTASQVCCMAIPWDGTRMVGRSVWKDVCAGGPIRLEKLLVDEFRGMPSKGSDLSGEREHLWDNFGAFRSEE